MRYIFLNLCTQIRIELLRGRATDKKLFFKCDINTIGIKRKEKRSDAVVWHTLKNGGLCIVKIIQRYYKNVKVFWFHNDYGSR